MMHFIHMCSTNRSQYGILVHDKATWYQYNICDALGYITVTMTITIQPTCYHYTYMLPLVMLQYTQTLLIQYRYFPVKCEINESVRLITQYVIV